MATKTRVIRSGSWNFIARFCSSACRNNIRHDFRFYGIGFRFVAADMKERNNEKT